jgi:hypothetical protein
MSTPERRKSYPFDRPGNYRIRVIGYLDESWSDRFAGMQITKSSPNDQGPVTSLVGHLSDQAELAGVLNTLYEMHLTLRSVEYLNGD